MRHTIFNVLTRIMLLLIVGFTLAGCAGIGPASVMGGDCKVFDDPGFAVRGARLKDSQWLGRTQEKGITVCHWNRPTK